MNAMLVVPLPLPRSRAPLLPRAHAPLAVRLSARLCSPPWAMPPLPRVPAPRFRAHAHWLSRATHPPSLPPSRVTRAAARLSSVVGPSASRASPIPRSRAPVSGPCRRARGSRRHTFALVRTGCPGPSNHPHLSPPPRVTRAAARLSSVVGPSALRASPIPRSALLSMWVVPPHSRAPTPLKRYGVRVCSRHTLVGPCQNQD